MSGSHEKLPWLFWAQLVLVAIVATLYFTLGGSSGGHGEGAENEASEASKQALKPIGDVAVSGAANAAAAGSERSGKDIVTKTCQSCHANGIANAPKMDESAKADWEARMAKGLNEVVAVAKKGKGAMPPMGTDPSLSDAELKNAVIYMLGEAGIDAGSSSSESDPAPAASTETTSEKPSESTMASTTTAEVAVDSDEAPLAPAAPHAPEPPATPETPSSSVVETAVASAAAVAATATEAVTEAKAAVVEGVTEAKSSIDGAKLYSTTCFACHDTGAAGAPKLGDKAAWADRIAKGKDALYEGAIKGTSSPTGVMPPKGGYMNLSDDEVKAIVDHIVSKSE